MRLALRILLFTLAVSLPATSLANHSEINDAGQTLSTYQLTNCPPYLEELRGITSTGTADVDMYRIVVADPDHFSAKVIWPDNGRHWVYLLTLTGTVVAGAAPNIPIAADIQSLLSSNSYYLLAVTPFGMYPYAASTRVPRPLFFDLGQSLSNPSPESLAIRPNGRYSTLPLSDWYGTYSADSSGPYAVALTGASCTPGICNNRLLFQEAVVLFGTATVLFGSCQ